MADEAGGGGRGRGEGGGLGVRRVGDVMTKPEERYGIP